MQSLRREAIKHKDNMKKASFILAALLAAFTFASCTVDTSKVKVTVVDQDNQPVADRKVYYTDLASAIISAALPDPTEPLRNDEGVELEHRTTNASGQTTFTFSLGVSSLTYYFYVPDEGADTWVLKSLKVKRGDTQELTIEVNK